MVQRPTVGVIAPMPNELRPLAKRLGLRPDRATGLPEDLAPHTGTVGGLDVVAVRTGIGPARAHAATEALLATVAPERVVVSGIAGGIEGASAVGDLIVPAEVLDAATGDRFRATPHGDVTPAGLVRTGDGTDYELGHDEIAALAAAGVVALDMETAAVARACAAHGVPWLAFRAVSDMAGDSSVGPVIMTLVHPDGRPKAGAALRFLPPTPAASPAWSAWPGRPTPRPPPRHGPRPATWPRHRRARSGHDGPLA
jgi:adenosylhomocysteine nucleosidase